MEIIFLYGECDRSYRVTTKLDGEKERENFN